MKFDLNAGKGDRLHCWIEKGQDYFADLRPGVRLFGKIGTVVTAMAGSTLIWHPIEYPTHVTLKQSIIEIGLGSMILASNALLNAMLQEKSQPNNSGVQILPPGKPGWDKACLRANQPAPKTSPSQLSF